MDKGHWAKWGSSLYTSNLFSSQWRTYASSCTEARQWLHELPLSGGRCLFKISWSYLFFSSVMQMRMRIEKTKQWGDNLAAWRRDFSLAAMQFHFVLTDSFHFVVFFFHLSLLFTGLHITGRVNKQPWWQWDVLLSVRRQSSTIYPWVLPHQDNALSKSRATLYCSSQTIRYASRRPSGEHLKAGIQIILLSSE